MIILLTDCPVSGLPRQFKNIKFLRDEAERRIVISGEVETLVNGEVFKTDPYEFAATDKHMVDETGTVVEEGGIMTEYDYYNLMATQVIDPHIKTAVEGLDSKGRFNETK